MYGLSISYYDRSQLSIVQLDWNVLSSQLFVLIKTNIYNRLFIVNGDLSSWNVSQVSFSSDYDTGANNWQSVNKPQF